jgi:hypothetical protein
VLYAIADKSAIVKAGTQLIKTTKSYMTNLRYSPVADRFYVRADKSEPNIFAFDAKTANLNDFKFYDESKFRFSTSFFAFDVINVAGKEYVVGTGLSKNTDRSLTTPIHTQDETHTNVGFPQPNIFLYTPIIDQGSVVGDSITTYFIGWTYTNGSMSAVVSKATIDLNTLIATFKPDDTLLLTNESTEYHNCFDVWTDINSPYMTIDIIDGKKYLIVAISGRCDAIIKIFLNPDVPLFRFATWEVYTESKTENKDIFSAAYCNLTKTLFFTYKEYNSESTTLLSFNIKTMNLYSVHRPIHSNNSVPILVHDNENDYLYIAQAGSDQVLKIPGADITKTAEIATLPRELSQVSSMFFNKGFLYVVTWEPAASIGRLDAKKSFCTKYCGSNSYCSNPPLTCTCSPGYGLYLGVCIPLQQVEVITTETVERTVSITLGVLFAIASAGAIIGWALWWRQRRSNVYTVTV